MIVGLLCMETLMIALIISNKLLKPGSYTDGQGIPCVYE
jgi:hypothetical protein